MAVGAPARDEGPVVVRGLVLGEPGRGYPGRFEWFEQVDASVDRYDVASRWVASAPRQRRADVEPVESGWVWLAARQGNGGVVTDAGRG